MSLESQPTKTSCPSLSLCFQKQTKEQRNSGHRLHTPNRVCPFLWADYSILSNGDGVCEWSLQLVTAICDQCDGLNQMRFEGYHESHQHCAHKLLLLHTTFQYQKVDSSSTHFLWYNILPHLCITIEFFLHKGHHQPPISSHNTWMTVL